MIWFLLEIIILVLMIIILIKIQKNKQEKYNKEPCGCAKNVQKPCMEDCIYKENNSIDYCNRKCGLAFNKCRATCAQSEFYKVEDNEDEEDEEDEDEEDEEDEDNEDRTYRGYDTRSACVRKCMNVGSRGRGRSRNREKCTNICRGP